MARVRIFNKNSQLLLQVYSCQSWTYRTTTLIFFSCLQALPEWLYSRGSGWVGSGGGGERQGEAACYKAALSQRDAEAGKQAASVLAVIRKDHHVMFLPLQKLKTGQDVRRLGCPKMVQGPALCLQSNVWASVSQAALWPRDTQLVGIGEGRRAHAKWLIISMSSAPSVAAFFFSQCLNDS